MGRFLSWVRGIPPAHWLLWPLPVLLLVFYALPLLGVFAWSVTLPEPGLGNYVQALTDQSIRDVSWRTAWVCVVVAVAGVGVAYLLAYTWLFSGAAMRRLIELGVLLPLWLSVLVRTFGWLIALRRNGIVNTWLQAWGWIEAPLELTRNDLGVLIGMVHFMVPFAFFPLLSAMRRVDERVLLAARGMGAGAARTFWQVFAPQTYTGVLGAFIMVVVFAMGFFIVPALLGGGQVLMLAEYIYLQMFQTSNWGLGAALSALLLIIVGVLAALLVRVTGLGKDMQENDR